MGTTPPPQPEQYRNDRFSCSMPAPATRSRHLYTGHHQDSTQAASWLKTHDFPYAVVPGSRNAPGFDAIVLRFDASAVVHTRSSSRHTPDPLTTGLFLQRSPPQLLTGAACSGLGSPPARRTRRANPHHQHSTLRATNLLHQQHSTIRTHSHARSCRGSPTRPCPRGT